MIARLIQQTYSFRYELFKNAIKKCLFVWGVLYRPLLAIYDEICTLIMMQLHRNYR